MAAFPDRIPIKSKAAPCWATMIPSRSPEFKAHSHIGLARSAMSYRVGNTYVESAALYELVGRNWLRRVEIGRDDTPELARAKIKQVTPTPRVTETPVIDNEALGRAMNKFGSLTRSWERPASPEIIVETISAYLGV